jgi:hypothetical protein
MPHAAKRRLKIEYLDSRTRQQAAAGSRQARTALLLLVSLPGSRLPPSTYVDGPAGAAQPGALYSWRREVWGDGRGT